MFVTVPIYVETRHGDEGQPTLFHVRPLFAHGPNRADGELERALQRLTQDVRELLTGMARDIRHESLAMWAWNPPVQEHRFELLIELRSRIARGRYFFVTLESLERKLAFCPGVDAVWFEVGRGQTLQDRALRVLTDYFRKLEREAFDESTIRPEDFALDGTAWVTSLELEIKADQTIPSADKLLKALLGGQDVSDGAAELMRCGRCLNWSYPHDLSRAIGRDREVGEVERKLTSSERRPVLVLGERLAGKTAVVHEYVARRTARREHAAATRQNVWLLSPQRLIAGMSFVGQWESRLLAILRYARKKDLVLYFDDFLGLYLAGQSRDSSLNMATVLKPYLERRDCRFLAEMTPEAWRILRERDRGLADMFDILPIRPATRDDTSKVVMGMRRQLEQRHHCRFHIDALTTVLDLQERFANDTAFPGKAVRSMRELALQHSRGNIGRDQVLDAFHGASGLTSRFLDPRHSVSREEIIKALQSEVIGQPAAVAAVAEVLTVAKAQMSDPRRPLGSLLFLGPTGVGKTQLAKATARYLFGDPQKLIRFDLNQFVHAGAAARLVGTFAHPDGQLTGAVRRSPFAVLLLDEVEKAHPEVFDLLLQVLGEGRLTDALGRTVSFTNTVIIMTSNLGVREAEQQLGFLGDAPVGDHVWVKTVERFFRPEFFNRIDRIVPFQRLSPEVVRNVAVLALNELLRRDGFSRRQSFLVVEPRALDQLVAEGYSPVWGARGLKRVLECQLVQPLARSLAAMSPQAVTRLQVYPAANGVAVQLDELSEAVAPPGSLCEGCRWKGLELVEQTRAWLEDVAMELDAYRPRGAISVTNLSPEHQAYYLLQERMRQVEQVSSALRDSLRSGSSTPGTRSARTSTSRKLIPRSDHFDRARSAWLREAMADDQFQSMLDAMEPEPQTTSTSADLERKLLRMIVMLHVEIRALVEGKPDRVALYFAPQQPSSFDRLPMLYFHALRPFKSENNLDWGFDAIWHESVEGERPCAVELQCLGAAMLAESEAGLHLESLQDRTLVAWNLVALPLARGETVAESWRIHVAQRAAWIDDVASGRSPVERDPWNSSRVLRLLESNGAFLDFRTSMIETGTDKPAFLRGAMLDVLPLPPAYQPDGKPV